jgi:hypothetical protein
MVNCLGKHQRTRVFADVWWNRREPGYPGYRGNSLTYTPVDKLQVKIKGEVQDIGKKVLSGRHLKK